MGAHAAPKAQHTPHNTHHTPHNTIIAQGSAAPDSVARVSSGQQLLEQLNNNSAR